MFGFPYQIHDASASIVPEKDARDGTRYQVTVYLRRRLFGSAGPFREQKWAISKWTQFSPSSRYRAVRLDKDSRILECFSARYLPWYAKVYEHVLELGKTDRIDLSTPAEPFPSKKYTLAAPCI